MNKIRIINSSRKTVSKVLNRFKMSRINKDNHFKKQQPTHFISIPFCLGEVRERYLNFKKEILEKYPDQPDVDEVLFQNPNKLHMTLGVMNLSNKTEQANAIEILKQCKADVIDRIMVSQSFKMRICGVGVLNNDPMKARVVYGKVHDSEQQSWQLLCDNIVDYFTKEGVMEKEYDQVKMHITLMNTVFRRKSSVETIRKNRKPIDVSSIIKEYENYEFGETTVDAIHLSNMRAVSSSGYYKPEIILDLRQNESELKHIE
ncbi:activating signal cointegrator 1 complex subunit 1 isoform X2 [Nilaparvata lugens]|uniref:activating signal cointegrator 1 complex subunit 1 isoform X2 n=1 Tax=Nilaparvata lugens TaxID=108931 RepID=UPI00193DAC0D|nr:activating signal cointegrator 1 complex subunit 1 isoform X2 [Nilaparvata lugens]